MSPTLRGQSDTPRDHMVAHTRSLLQRNDTSFAERAVEVTSNISHLLEGAEETPQLLDNIFQLEQYGFLLPFGFHRPGGKVLGP